MSTRSTIKKTLRSFHARDSLWEAFSNHAEELDCSVDYLINEAMKLYSRENQLLGDQELSVSQPPPEAVSEETPVPAKSELIQPMPPLPKKDTAPTVNEKPSAKLPRPGGARPSLTGPQPLPRPGNISSAAPSPVAAPVPTPPRRPSSATAPPVAPVAEGSETKPTLTLVFQGQKYPIVSDQFIIGRGSKSSDLAIKDANISRKHAAVIYHSGAFYMKDLGSTNGIEFNGNPIDSKRIDEGDVFSVCGFDFHFTYSA